MNKQSHVNMPLSEHMTQGIKRLIEVGEFASIAEYLRFLVRTDLPRRLSQLERDQIILERLNQAKQGGPIKDPRPKEAGYFRTTRVGAPRAASGSLTLVA